MTDIVDLIRARLRDGRTISDGDVRLAADEIERLRACLEGFASYPCTCHEAFHERGMIDPQCMAGEVGADALEALGREGICKGVAARRERAMQRLAQLDQEFDAAPDEAP